MYTPKRHGLGPGEQSLTWDLNNLLAALCAQSMTAATSQLLSTINTQTYLSLLTKKTVNQTMNLIKYDEIVNNRSK